jgi:mannose-1-phosphate guanylyltransferase/mannose-6-phosphate isomerase
MPCAVVLWLPSLPIEPEDIVHAEQGRPSVLPCPIVHVALAGGAGTRLWPVSRASAPKQTSLDFGAESLLQVTVRRLRDTAAEWDARRLWVVCGAEHRFLVSAQLDAIGLSSARLILEPVKRSTAPALTLAALRAEREFGDAILVVSPVDHAIDSNAAFGASVTYAIRLAAEGRVVTLGVVPTTAQTGYGYIELGNPVDGGYAVGMRRFVEKPDADTAARYLAGGRHWWNCGVFVMKASVWLALARQYQPELVAACLETLAVSLDSAGALVADADLFSSCPSVSIDYAVMERLPFDHPGMGVVVPLHAAWSDMGSWDAVWAASRKNADGNAQHGRAVLEGVTNSIVHAQHRLVVCVGVEDVVVIETADAVLVADRKMSRGLSPVVERLRRQACVETAVPRRAQRPWGNFDVVDAGDGFRVKRLRVEAGASLSLQQHAHRSEHWVVVNGLARVTCEDREFVLRKNESTHIPAGAWHRLANAGNEPLEVIEVQTGSYFGEDDTVRRDDLYGRAEPAATACSSRSSARMKTGG